MGFLDKLKPQPRWKHADPAIRLEAVRDLDDQIELVPLAEGDPDVRVRRAAVARLADVEALGRLAAGDADAEVKDRAADRLLGFAMNGSSDLDTALTAVRALVDARRLASVAKSDGPEAIREAALGRITDERALGGVARHAKQEATATAALARMTDTNELLEVALHSDHRDVALVAFDRSAASSTDLDLLRNIEARGQQKAVSRRARALIQELEAAEVARRAAIEERRRREASVLEAVERLVDVADTSVARAEIGRLTESWTTLDVADGDARERFSAAVVAVNAAIARREREQEEAAERARLRTEAIATRDALCARVETLDGEDSLEQLIPIEEEWRSLLPLVGNGPEADRLAERFAQAVAACRKRHEMGVKLSEGRVALDALVAEAEGLPSQDDVAAASARWQSLSREARGLTALLTDASRPTADLTARLEAVGQALSSRTAARDAAVEAAAEKARQDVIGQLTRLAERARRAAEAESITLREGERLMRDIAAGIEAAGHVPSTREIEAAAEKLRTQQEAVAPRVRELREMDDWRRFANAQRQEQLIAMAEAIVASLKTDEEAGKTSDLAATARALKELHAKWHEVAEAPRQVAQRLWDRFRTATDFIRSRCESYFAKLREERETNLQKRASIVVEAEQLAASSDWGRAAARFQELQNEWQQGGTVVREAGRDLAHRFRVACNTFFSRRREDLADRKKTWSENMARKEALCERAEALVESTDWENASAEMKRLQAEWKTVGPVRRNKSEVIWTRFRSAADHFFERYHHRHEIALSGKLAEREAMVVDLEALVGTDPDTAAHLAERVQQLRATWNRAVPIPAAGMRPLTDRWQAALAKLVETHPQAFAGTDLDPAAIIQRMQKLVARVENLSVTPQIRTEGLSSAELLAARLRSALASNAMGGRANDESKIRAALDAVKEAQASWQRLPPVGTPEARTLEQRFREACRHITDQGRRQTTSNAPARRPARQTAAAV